METSPRTEAGQAGFRTTHWTVVLAAARPGASEASEAFGRLYLDYWYPLYAFVRRRGQSPANAEDITQNFFLHLMTRQALEGLTRDGGRFRSFLLRSLENFLANEWDRARALKRGAGQPLLSLNADAGETQYLNTAQERDTPETLFERQWVFTLLEHVMGRLRAECEGNGKGELFRDLLPHLQGDHSGPPYAELATRRQTTEGAIKVVVHRLRQRYGELLREEIARTVSRPEEVDEELRYLKAVSGG